MKAIERLINRIFLHPFNAKTLFVFTVVFTVIIVLAIVALNHYSPNKLW